MGDEQVAAGLEVPLEHRHHALLHGLVEVDHHVAAEDEVEAPAERRDLEQVEGAEVDQLAQRRAMRASRLLADALFEVAPQQRLPDVGDLPIG